MNHDLMMTIAMFLAGIFSTMNIWENSWSDIRLSLNDMYMIGLMIGWMFFFMGILMLQWKKALMGLLIAGLILAAIRTQFLVDQTQFLLQMIPHHSMGIFLSRKLEQKPNTIPELLNNIVHVQENEIEYMKKKLKEA